MRRKGLPKGDHRLFGFGGHWFEAVVSYEVEVRLRAAQRDFSCDREEACCLLVPNRSNTMGVCVRDLVVLLENLTQDAEVKAFKPPHFD